MRPDFGFGSRATSRTGGHTSVLNSKPDHMVADLFVAICHKRTSDVRLPLPRSAGDSPHGNDAFRLPALGRVVHASNALAEGVWNSR